MFFAIYKSCFLSRPLSSVHELTTSAHISVHARPYEKHACAALTTCSFSKKPPSASCGCIISSVPVDRRSGTSVMCQRRLQFCHFLKTDTFGNTPVYQLSSVDLNYFALFRCVHDQECVCVVQRDSL